MAASRPTKQGAKVAWRRGSPSKRFANHPLNQQNTSIVEKAFQLRSFAEKGDALARSIFARQAEILGYAFGDIASTFDPGLIVIGGGLAGCGISEWYIGHVRAGFAERARPFYQRNPLDPQHVTNRIEWAIGGDNAASYGAANKAMDLVA